jgi:carboxyl-terminal processing protease
MQLRRHVAWVVPLVFAGAVLGGVLTTRSAKPVQAAAAPSAPPPAPAADDEDDDRGPSFRAPTERPAHLSCAQARTVVGQLDSQLAYVPDELSAHELSVAIADWLDPHGLWSAADDSPLRALLDQRAKALLGELHATNGSCASAEAIGAALVPWVREMRAVFDASRAQAIGDPLASARETLGDDTTSARSLAAQLGRRTGDVERAPELARYAAIARDRLLPELAPSEWAEIVLAAAVRAYVPLVDPHGAWAPLGEEATVYEVDLEAHPAPRLWERASRTTIGVRVDAAPAAPLQVGDVLLEAAGLTTAGIALEQVDQLSFVGAEANGPLVVLRERGGKPQVVRLDAPPPAEGDHASSEREAAPGLASTRIRFGASDVLVVSASEVKDDMGALLARTLSKARGEGPLAGVVLDLRGNGGGSTEGAIDVLGMFLPRAALFPMKRRDGTLETDRAPEPPASEQWSGPVATLVDGMTASAAEMIAGALSAYRRGPSVGVRTYGKGCAQEYVDDDAHTGVLRMTTLLYALPDGTPVQRAGLAPTLEVVPTARPAEDDREARIAHAPPTWRGPDVRDRRLLDRTPAPWPTADGAIGPCDDAYVCRALGALAGWSPRKPVARGHGAGSSPASTASANAARSAP